MRFEGFFWSERCKLAIFLLKNWGKIPSCLNRGFVSFYVTIFVLGELVPRCDGKIVDSSIVLLRNWGFMGINWEISTNGEELEGTSAEDCEMTPFLSSAVWSKYCFNRCSKLRESYWITRNQKGCSIRESCKNNRWILCGWN